MNYLLSYITTLLSLLAMDAIWLGVLSKQFYQHHLGYLFKSSFNIPVIILFYVLYAGAIVYFVIIPSGGSVSKAIVSGALLGFTAYMTYDLVNFATIDKWPLKVVIVDILWGVIITLVASYIAVLVTK